MFHMIPRRHLLAKLLIHPRGGGRSSLDARLRRFPGTAPSNYPPATPVYKWKNDVFSCCLGYKGKDFGKWGRNTTFRGFLPRNTDACRKSGIVSPMHALFDRLATADIIPGLTMPRFARFEWPGPPPGAPVQCKR
jgi:hypothetical protein